MSYFDIPNMKLYGKIKRFPNKQKLRNIICICLSLNMFFIQKLVNNNLIKKSYHHPLECLAGHRSFRLTQFPTSQLGLILRVWLILKSFSKITLGLVIGETRYLCEEAFSKLAIIKCKNRSLLKSAENVLCHPLSCINLRMDDLCKNHQMHPSH